MTLVELARISLSEDFPQVLFFVGQSFVFGEEVQDGLAARENVETHLNHLLPLNLIQRYCLLLPNFFRYDPVQHSEVEIEIEVSLVVELHGKYIVLAILKAPFIKLLFVKLAFLLEKLLLKIVFVLSE